jgi:hypothetical protein
MKKEIKLDPKYCRDTTDNQRYCPFRSENELNSWCTNPLAEEVDLEDVLMTGSGLYESCRLPECLAAGNTLTIEIK